VSDTHILVLDAGTTSTRAMLYAPDGALLHVAQAPIAQHYPQDGWVEQDAEEIFATSLACLRQAVEAAGGARRVAAIGIANQRETVVAWDRQTGRPLCPAIVWQDRRTAPECAALRKAGHEAAVQQRTGLLLDPYFSATKMAWIMRHVPEARALGRRLAFGTVESWVTWKLTGGLHLSDVTNASRTALFALHGATWDASLCDLFGVPLTALPEVVGNAGRFVTLAPDWLGGPIPLCGLAGDQQAATIGQGCLSAGQGKATFGTGAFVLVNTGSAIPRSTNRLLGTVLCDVAGARSYALEGSIFDAGSLIKWLRDGLGLLESAAESEVLARSVTDSGGVMILPALSGLGAPHWRPDARGTISGLTHATGRAHVVRAALESMAHQCHDLARAFAADGASWQLLRIDGGMSANDWLAQDLADVLDLPLERPSDTETTARGAAMLAAVGAGLYPDLAAACAMLPHTRRFVPDMDPAKRSARLAGWSALLARSL